MSSADHYPQPAPPPMQSPYGMPAGPGGPGDPGDFGPHGPAGPGGSGNPDRRRKTLMASALAVVAVVGIGGTVAALSGGGSSKPTSTALAGTEASTTAGPTEGGDFPGAVVSGSGKPNGDTIPGGGTIPGADIPNGPGATSAASSNGAPGAPGADPGSTQPGRTTGGAPTKPGSPASTGAPAHPGTSAPAPGAPASSRPPTSNPPTSAPRPSTPGSTAPKPTTPPPPSTDCTYLDLPPQQMPQIQEGSGNANAVKQLQCLLKKSMLGIKPLAVDGVWGSDTQSALTNFQSCNNAPTVKSPGGTPPYPKLSVDGVAGPQTWADLYFWDNQYFNNVAYYCNGTR